jgi:imidazolonepropionase-like amidohydrolase
MNFRSVVVCLVGFCTLLRAEGPAAFAIRDARIVTVSGPEIERGTVLVRDGLIEAVGANLTIPADAWVIEGKGLTVYPGLIDALSTWGIPEAAPPAQGRTGQQPVAASPQPVARGPEDRPSNNSWVRAADLVNTSDKRIEAARSAGFTTAVTFPAHGIFAGEGAVIDLGGDRAGQMVVASPVGEYLTFTTSGFSSFPGSLMGVIAYIRQVYLDAEHYRLAREMYQQSPVGLKRPAYDRSLEGVLEAPRVLLPATRAVDIERMVNFAAELKKPAILYGAHEGWRALDALEKSRLPVLVSLKWPERSKDANPEEHEPLRTLELREHAPGVPAALAKAGVKFAFYSDNQPKPSDVIKAASRALDAGLTPEDAIRAFTLSAAEIYGVADRMGSVEKGKIANLVIADGPLFQDHTKVKHVFVDGVKYEPVPEEPPAGARTGRTQ